MVMNTIQVPRKPQKELECCHRPLFVFSLIFLAYLLPVIYLIINVFLYYFMISLIVRLKLSWNLLI